MAVLVVVVVGVDDSVNARNDESIVGDAAGDDLMTWLRPLIRDRLRREGGDVGGFEKG